MDYCGLTVTVVWKMFLGLNFAGPYWWKLPQNPTQSHVGFPQLTPDETMKHTREVYHRAFWKKVVLRRVDHFSGVNLQFNFQGVLPSRKHGWKITYDFVIGHLKFIHGFHFPLSSSFSPGFPRVNSPSCSVAFQVSEVRDFGEAWSLDFRWMDGFGSPPSTGRGGLRQLLDVVVGKKSEPQVIIPNSRKSWNIWEGDGRCQFWGQWNCAFLHKR